MPINKEFDPEKGLPVRPPAPAAPPPPPNKITPELLSKLKRAAINEILASIGQAHRDGTLKVIAPPKPLEAKDGDVQNLE